MFSKVFKIFFDSRVHLCAIALLALDLACVFPDVALATDPPLTDIKFAPNAELIAAVSQKGLHIHSWPSLKQLRVVPLKIPNLHAIAFSQDGSYVAVSGGFPSESGETIVLAWPECTSVLRVNTHFDSVMSTLLIEDMLVTAALDREIHATKLSAAFHSLSQTKILASERQLRGHSRGVLALCSLPADRLIVSGAIDSSIRVWDLDKRKFIRTLNQHTAQVNSIALRPQNLSSNSLPMIVSAGADRTLRFWQPTIGRMVRYARLDSIPQTVVWLADARHVAAGCQDGMVRIINAEQLTQIHALPALEGWVYAMAIHPDGTIAVGGSNGQLRRLEISKIE